MIGKVSSGASFSGLAKYLAGDEERVAWTEPRWMIGTDPKEVAREMEAAASLAGSRLEKPVYHVSISFGEADNPTREQMREAADRVLGELGLSEHQAFLVAHDDKGHPHLHVMVNRVHPDTGKAADVGFDYRRVEGVLRELEKEWGMQRVPGHHARDAGDAAPDRAQSVATGEARRADRTGEASFPEQIRENMGDDLNRAIEQSKNWDELRAALARYGYRIEPTERGMKITDGEHYAKASGVDERLGRFRLEERFGARLPAEEPREVSPSAAAGRETPDRSAAPDAGTTSRAGGGATSPEPDGRGAAREGAPAPDGDSARVYESVFGKPALERTPAQVAPEGPVPSGGSGAGQLLGAAAVAARPVSSEDGEKEVPFRATEMGLRAAAALVSRSGDRSDGAASPPESRAPAEVQSGDIEPGGGPAERPAVHEKTPGADGAEPASQTPAMERAASLDRTGSPTLPAPDGEVRAIVRDVQAYERFADLEARLGRAAGSYAEAERTLQAGGRQGQEAARLAETFDRALGEAYRDPAAARRAFEARAAERGPESAARAMRQAPEQFGEVVATERKKWMGLANEVSKADGYAAARGAANVGEQYLHTRQATPDAGSRLALEGALKTRGAEMKALRQELGQFTQAHGSPSELLRGIGERTQKLTTAQMNGLRRALTPMQFGVVTKAAGLAAEAVKGRTR